MCASDSILCDNDNSLVCSWLLYSKFGPLGKTPSKFRTCEQFLCIFIPNTPSIWEIPKSGCKGKNMIWSCDGIQICTIDLVFNLLIGRHLILFPQKLLHHNWTGLTNFSVMPPRACTKNFKFDLTGNSPLGRYLGPDKLGCHHFFTQKWPRSLTHQQSVRVGKGLFQWNTPLT